MLFEICNDFVVVRYATDAQLMALDRELQYQSIDERTLAWRANQGGRENAWDGVVKLLGRQRRDGSCKFSTGLLPRASRLCRKLGYPLQVTDLRVRPPLGTPTRPPIPLFDYQQKAVDAAMAAGRGVIDLSPRAGKTRLMAEVVRQVALPTLWVAPTGPIVRQTVAVLRQFLGTRAVTELRGGKLADAAARTQVVVCTAATTPRLPESFFVSRQCLVVDEWHHAAAKTYKMLFRACQHVYYRYGMTGTHFRSGGDDMAMEALLSNVVYRLSSRELMVRGRLVPCDVVMLGTAFPPVLGINPADFIGSVGKLGAFEHPRRQMLVARCVQLLLSRGRHVLVLVRTIEQGRQLQAMIAHLLPGRPPAGCRYKACEFVSGQEDRHKVDGVLRSFVERQEVRCLIGTSLIGEGCDLPSADALVYAAAGKAEVTLVQNAYRVCTAAPGKPPVSLIIDFGDNHVAKLLDQASDRLGVYCAHGIFRVDVLRLPGELPAWLDKHHPVAKKAAHPDPNLRVTSAATA